MKDYQFSSEEMTVLRDALVEEYHRAVDWHKMITEVNPRNVSERGLRRVCVLKALKEQFQEDCHKMK